MLHEEEDPSKLVQKIKKHMERKDKLCVKHVHYYAVNLTSMCNFFNALTSFAVDISY